MWQQIEAETEQEKQERLLKIRSNLLVAIIVLEVAALAPVITFLPLGYSLEMQQILCVLYLFARPVLIFGAIVLWFLVHMYNYRIKKGTLGRGVVVLNWVLGLILMLWEALAILYIGM